MRPASGEERVEKRNCMVGDHRREHVLKACDELDSDLRNEMARLKGRRGLCWRGGSLLILFFLDCSQ